MSLLLLAPPLFAQLPQARLAWVFPPALRSGATNALNVGGSDLDEPAGLRFSDARITAAPRPGNPSAFTVVVPAEVPPGLVDVRFAGRFGVSNPRAVAVTDAPDLLVPATNTTPAAALELPVGTAANGRAQPNSAAWFRVSAQAGERLLVRVQARELDSRLEPVLTLLDAAQRDLGRSRRGFLDFTVPAGGVCFLKLHDQIYRGGDDHPYRLTVTAGPHLDFALPLVLRAGETNRVTLFGRNLPGGRRGTVNGADGMPLEELAVELAAPAAAAAHPEMPAELLRKPAAAMLAGEAWAWRLSATNGVSNPLLFTLTDRPVFSAATPARDGLTPVTTPGEFSGLFPQRGEAGGVTFAAQKGEALWLEAFSDRLGFPTDPHAVVQRERGTKGERGETLHADVLELADGEANLGGTEFNTATRDAAARFVAPETGTYRVLLRDLFNSGSSSPRYPYRLSLRRETPGFALAAVPVQPPRANDNDRAVHAITPFLRRGETRPVKVVAFRRDGFGGDIELSATNLPPGVTAGAARIAAGQNTGFVLLSAAEDAAAGAAAATITGRGMVGADFVSAAAPLATLVNPVADSNEQAVTARLAREAIVSVSGAEFAPVSLSLGGTNRFAVPAGGKFTVPVRLVRRGEFTAAFNVKPAGRPELDKVKEATLPEKATNATVEINLADAKLPEGAHVIWLQGTIAGKYRNNPEALATAEAALKAEEAALAAAAPADKPAAEQRKKTAEETKKAAEERAKPRDVTVPVWSPPFVVEVLPAPKPEEKR